MAVAQSTRGWKTNKQTAIEGYRTFNASIFNRDLTASVQIVN